MKFDASLINEINSVSALNVSKITQSGFVVESVLPAKMPKQSYVVRFRAADLKQDQPQSESVELYGIWNKTRCDLFVGLYRPQSQLAMATQALSMEPGKINLEDTLVKVKKMKGVILTERQKRDIAQEALLSRFNDYLQYPLLDEVYRPRRFDDLGYDLMTTVGVVFENLIKGGIRIAMPASPKFTRTRKLDDVAKSIVLGQHLWKIADKYLM